MFHLDAVAQVNHWRHRSLTEKAGLALGMLVLVMILPPIPTAPMVICIMVAATLGGARVPVRLWALGMLAPVGFLVAGILPIAWDNPTLAAMLALRSMAAVSCLMFLTLTSPATDVIRGLRRLGIPAEVGEIAVLVYRLLFLFADTATAMSAAQASRLGHRQRLRSLGILLANLLPSAMARAKRMEAGLMSRGWNGEMRVLSTATPVSRSALAVVIALELGIALIGWTVS